MPWSPKQHRFFEFVAHGGQPRDAKNRHIDKATAARLASEGVADSGETTKRKAQKKALKEL